MKIIKKLRGYQTTCPNCKTILEVAEEDVKEEPWKYPDGNYLMEGIRRYYICPVCNKKTTIYEEFFEPIYEDEQNTGQESKYEN